MSSGTYAPVRTSFWTDPDVRTSLTRDAKLLLLYFISSPHSNLIGLYSAPFAYVAREVEMTEDEVRFHTHVSLAPFVTYDENTEEVFVHGMARHKIGESLKGGDRKRAGVVRMWRDGHSPELRAAFCRKYAEWGFDEPDPAVPDGYKLLTRPLPGAPGVPYVRRVDDTPSEGASKGHLQPPSTPTPTHSPDLRPTPSEKHLHQPRRVDDVEKSEENDRPAYTKAELLEAARTVCGLNKWSSDEQGRAASVLSTWAAEGRTTQQIHAAIHGARLLVDAGEVNWIKPRSSFGLRALRNQHTLADQGDGRAQRPFFDVAEEAYLASTSGSARRTTHGPAKLAVELASMNAGISA